MRRWSHNSGMITVVFELGLDSSKIWLCSTTIVAVEDDGPRCSRRVDDVKVNKGADGLSLMGFGCDDGLRSYDGVDGIEAPLVPMIVASNGGVDGWRRWMASDGGFEWWLRMVASMGGVDGWLRMVASDGGFEWWRRWVASMVDVDAGLGSSTQRH